MRPEALLRKIHLAVEIVNWTNSFYDRGKMNRRHLLAWAAGAVAAGILFPFDSSFMAWAVEPADIPVVITRNDGTSVKGKITSYDKDKVTIDAIGKPKDPPVSTDIAWDDIKRVSNGLTRSKALQKWKGEHHDALCQMCYGDGKIFCPTCHGTAHDPAASVGCPTCKGAAQLACTTKKCDHGNIPCPNPRCLKLSDSGWVKKPDGLRWKRFNGPNGAWWEWSEHHIGQVVDKVNGQWQNLGTCPVCGGVSTITDPVCRGSSEMPCPTCVKRTKSPPCPDKCDAGTVQCPTCKGTGLKA
jgi:hypothetical protein